MSTEFGLCIHTRHTIERLVTENKMSSFWWHFHHLLQWNLPFWQLSAASNEHFVKITIFPFQWYMTVSSLTLWIKFAVLKFQLIASCLFHINDMYIMDHFILFFLSNDKFSFHTKVFIHTSNIMKDNKNHKNNQICTSHKQNRTMISVSAFQHGFASQYAHMQ